LGHVAFAPVHVAFAPLSAPSHNIYLDPLDWLMAGHGFEMARYADDMVVMCRSREEAGKALETIREWMAGVGLTLHPDKTRVVDMSPQGSYFDFLGYRFKRSRGRLIKLVRPKSLGKLRESIKHGPSAPAVGAWKR
jgi:RNA-directed DNA polymerase